MANNKRKLKHKIIAVASSFVLLAQSAYTLHNSTISYYLKDYNQNIDVGVEPYDKYIFGNIYIGESEVIRGIEDKVNKSDILIIDSANDDTKPEYKVLNSYRVKTLYEKVKILRSLYNYDSEKKHTKWNRSFSTLFFEWIGHNISHTVHYKRDRTADVDFDNEDEDTYKLFTKVK